MNSPERRKLAEALASKLEILNEREKKKLIACGNGAFKPVYRRVQYFFDECNKNKKSGVGKKKLEEQEKALKNGLDVLIKVSAPENSGDLATLLETRAELMPNWIYIMDIIMKCEEQDLVELFFRFYEKKQWSIPGNRKRMCNGNQILLVCLA